MGLLRVKECLTVGKRAQIRGKALEQLRERTHRMGDLVTIRDKRNRDFRARVVTITSEKAGVFIFESFENQIEPPIEIHLLQALLKKERLERIIQKTTELGISSIVPFESAHSITLEERDTPQKKSHRWQAVAIRAAQQCRRARVPYIYPVYPFGQALKHGGRSGLRLLLWEKESSRGMKHLLSEPRGPITEITLVVGPEGGFSRPEIDLAHENGYVSVSLGTRILRTETAVIAAISILQYMLGDLGGKLKKRPAEDPSILSQ